MIYNKENIKIKTFWEKLVKVELLVKISQDYASPYVTKTCLIVKKLFDSDFYFYKIIDSKNKILTLLVAYMKLICNLSIKSILR